MITLNGDKELVRVENWEAIQARPDFDGQLNPAAHELAAIIGSYVFSEYIACGLSNCRTPHGRGYLVVTKDARVTNIGKDCGARYFGVDFEDLTRQFDKDIAAKENRERLWSFAFRLDTVSADVVRIRKGEGSDAGADSLYKRSRALLNLTHGCPDVVVRRVIQMLKTGTSEVLTQREATNAEIARVEAATGRRVNRPHYIEESAGHVGYLEALNPENDLREMLVIDLDENLKAFSQLDIDQLSHAQLQRWAKWVSGVDATIERAELAVLKYRELLRPANLTVFAVLLPDDGEELQFRRFLDSLSRD
ncbi:hypothetical protein [Paraburkholderia phenoliruptrix]|uniref:hypothetical protein n=1 Tax=Paraburkholderia phenoliruptrix TaxID=252970 RepID=UPI0028699882|nr:hypothetical protein [Paraburkholderia phenoliruptrix]WMY11757.1 hypothetical protein P3F88_20305 [Paraburkholderia phenoliruptrix]